MNAAVRYGWILTALGAVASGGCTVEVPAQAVATSTVPAVTSSGGAAVATAGVVAAAPPAPIAEVVPPSPGPQYVWVDGYWDYGATGYAWVPGQYTLPPAGYVGWVPHRWYLDGGGWRRAPGYWSRQYVGQPATAYVGSAAGPAAGAAVVAPRVGVPAAGPAMVAPRGGYAMPPAYVAPAAGAHVGAPAYVQPAAPAWHGGWNGGGWHGGGFHGGFHGGRR